MMKKVTLELTNDQRNKNKLAFQVLLHQARQKEGTQICIKKFHDYFKSLLPTVEHNSSEDVISNLWDFTDDLLGQIVDSDRPTAGTGANNLLEESQRFSIAYTILVFQFSREGSGFIEGKASRAAFDKFAKSLKVHKIEILKLYQSIAADAIEVLLAEERVFRYQAVA